MVSRLITNYLFSTPLFPYCLAWRDFWSIWSGLEHYTDLQGLIAWAGRKRLTGVKDHYSHLLVETEVLLAHQQMRRRNLTFWARQLHFIYRSLIAKPKYCPKGGAEKYRLRHQ